MSNGRHFNPPTPAYRPRDPFAAFEPRSAERIPSCETTKPPPSRSRPVRVDGTTPVTVAVPASLGSGVNLVPSVPVKKEAAPMSARPAEALRAPARQEPVKPAVRQEPVKPVPTARPEAAQHIIPAAPKAEPVVARAERPPQPPVVTDDKHKRTREEAKAPPAPVAAPLKKGSKPPEAPKEAPKKAASRPPEKAEAPAERPEKKRPAEPVAKEPSDEESLVCGPGEEVRICEWDKCGKKFVVKVGGRAVVRRFCTGTCRGRASEARTGKR